MCSKIDHESKAEEPGFVDKAEEPGFVEEADEPG